MQRNAVHGCGHAVLAHAIMEVATGKVLGGDRFGLAGLGIVGPGQIGRTAKGFRHTPLMTSSTVFGGLAGGHRRLVIGQLLLVGADCFCKRRRQFAGETAVELGLQGLVLAAQAAFPFGEICSATATGGPPCGEHVIRDHKGFSRPAEGRPGCSDFFRAKRRAVAPWVPSLLGEPKPITVLQAIIVGLSEACAVSIAAAMASWSWPSMAMVFQPAARKRPCWSVVSVMRYLAVDGYVVVVPEDESAC